MQRVSYRTLFLLLLLLGLIIVQQHTAKADCVKPDAVWLADEPNEPAPEWIGPCGSWTFLDADEPNTPGPEMVLGNPPALWLDDDPNEPGPETAMSVPPAIRLDDDPNEPGQSGPERA
jgi:hypothetical protein